LRGPSRSETKGFTVPSVLKLQSLWRIGPSGNPGPENRRAGINGLKMLVWSEF